MDKVPTALSFHHKTGGLLAWGAQVDLDDTETNVAALFKLHVDPQHERSSTAPTWQEAQSWLATYLHYVYLRVIDFLKDSVPRWLDKQIEFHFSTPTTWNNTALIEEFRRMISSAGWGQEQRHIVVIGATEAEAAAMHASLTLQSFNKGEVILICDAGGGTTDINILKVKDSGYSSIQLDALTTVEGSNLGSAIIDFDVRDMLAYD